MVCGRLFRPEVLEHLRHCVAETPAPSRTALAREVCLHLAWYSPNGRPALSSAKVALRTLERRGLLALPDRARRAPGTRRLRRSGRPLPPLAQVPARVDHVEDLRLVLITDQHDPLSATWNDLIIAQHPCGAAPVCGPQLRYLIGSAHGWLGAVAFGPAAFVLGARDGWIGWSPTARLAHLREVAGLARLLIRQEVRCANLVSKVLSVALDRLPADWQARYGVRPVLVETFVDRARFTGCSFAAANWRRIGCSTGRGRLGPSAPAKSRKDIWVMELEPQARRQLQTATSPPLTPCPLADSLAQADWTAHELATLELGDARLERRARAVLAARWAQPQASFYGSFEAWAPAKGAYALIEHPRADVSLARLLAPHAEATQQRMAAEPLVLLPQDTTTLNFTGLRQTTGLGPLGAATGRGLWLHSLLAYRPDGVPLGLLDAACWARPATPAADPRGRNAKSLDEKESARWLESFRVAAAAARRMPQTQLVVLADREGDLYELHEAAQLGPANLHTVIRAQHDRVLECHQKLGTLMAAQPLGERRALAVPRRRGQPARPATLEVRWAEVAIPAPATGAKKSWPPLRQWAVWVREVDAPAGVEPIEWMLLTDLPVREAAQAWEQVSWYGRRWGIEEWHRALKSGCGAEQREFKTAEHLRRALAFDLIVAWRVLACVKLGRALPQLSARVLYREDELTVLWRTVKKNFAPAVGSNVGGSQPLGGAARRVCRARGGRRTRSGECRPWAAPLARHGARLAHPFRPAPLQ